MGRDGRACLALCLHALVTVTGAIEHGIPIEIQLWDTGRTPLAHMVDVTNEFGLKVLAEHNFLNDNNIAFSPYGLTGIMVALYEGIDGESSYQIQRGMQMPWNRNVMRVGFRDIHRTLKTYFVPEEGFLAGLALNNENVTFTNEYKKILRFYGFDLDRDQLPTLAPQSNNTESNATTAAPPPTPGESITVTMPAPPPAREDTTSTTESPKEETTTTLNPNAETLTEIDVRAPTTTVAPLVADAEIATDVTAPSTDPIATTTSGATETTPLETTTRPPMTVAETVATTETSPTTAQETTANEVETVATPETTATSAAISIADTITTPGTNEASTETASTGTADSQTTEPMTTEATTMETTTVANDTNLETLQRKRKSVADFIFTNSPPYVDDYLIYRAYEVPAELPKPTGRGSMFLVNGLRNVEVTYMHYDTILEHAYLPHLEASALRLPLDSDRYYLLVVLPSHGGPADLGRLIARMARESDLRDVHAALRPRRVKAVVPSFTVKGHITLTTDLQKIGIRDVFEPRQRDFIPMTPQAGVYVRSIEQAVSVAIRKYSPDDNKRNRYVANHQPVQFGATYPFVYFVMDASIHVALMAGKMVDPLNTRIL